jgi:ArsR family metal-binding transcriptional regulator
MTFLDSIALIQTLPCLAEPGKIVVVGKPSRSLAEVLPYMAALPDVVGYNPEACTLTFRRSSGFLTLHADRVYLTQVRDAEAGVELLASLVDAINATWTHRHALAPVNAARRAPRLLEVWSLLPRTNCRQCGEATCMAFAAAVLQRRRPLAECPPMRDDASLSGQRASLEAML